MQTFANETVTRLTYDGRINLIKSILQQPTTNFNEHWGVVWGSLWALLGMNPGLFSPKSQTLLLHDTLNDEFIKQFYITELAEETPRFSFHVELECASPPIPRARLTASMMNFRFRAYKFAMSSKHMHKSEASQLQHLFSPFTTTYIDSIVGKSAVVVHNILIPMVFDQQNSETTPFYFVSSVFSLPLLTLFCSPPSNFSPSPLHSVSPHQSPPLSSSSPSHVSSPLNAPPRDSPRDSPQSHPPQQNDSAIKEKCAASVYLTESSRLSSIPHFRATSDISQYQHIFDTLTDASNLLLYHLTLILLGHTKLATPSVALGLSQASAYLRDTIHEIIESLNVAFTMLISPTSPQQPDLSSSPSLQALNKAKRHRHVFSPDFLSLVVTAHLETYTTVVLVQNDQTIFFLHNLFCALNPQHNAALANFPFTCFPFYLPHKNIFLQTMFLTELDDQQLFSFPLPFCVINTQTHQVAVSRSQSLCDHLANRATGLLVSASRVFGVVLPIVYVPPEQSIRLLHKAPSTDAFARKIVDCFEHGRWGVGYWEAFIFLEFFKQKARVLLELVEEKGLVPAVLDDAEAIFGCMRVDELMLILGILKGRKEVVAELYALVERRLVEE